MRARIWVWAASSLGLGLVLVLASFVLPLQPDFRTYDRPGLPLLLYSGISLGLLAVAVWWGRRGLADALDDNERPGGSADDAFHPYATLFLISFVTLFLEVSPLSATAAPRSASSPSTRTSHSSPASSVWDSAAAWAAAGLYLASLVVLLRFRRPGGASPGIAAAGP